MGMGDCWHVRRCSMCARTAHGTTETICVRRHGPDKRGSVRAGASPHRRAAQESKPTLLASRGIRCRVALRRHLSESRAVEVPWCFEALRYCGWTWVRHDDSVHILALEASASLQWVFQLWGYGHTQRNAN